MSGKSGSDGLSGLTIAQGREYLVRTVDAGRLMGDPVLARMTPFSRACLSIVAVAQAVDLKTQFSPRGLRMQPSGYEIIYPCLGLTNEIAVINQIEIQKYKSIDKLVLPLGRVNVFIGENGAGKSNILEAVALAGAAASKKLDNEFLTSRGIRVTRPEYMRSAFPGFSIDDPISLSISMADGSRLTYKLTNDNQPYSKWICEADAILKEKFSADLFIDSLKSFIDDYKKNAENEKEDLVKSLKELSEQFSKATSHFRSRNGGDSSPRDTPGHDLAFTLDQNNLFGRYLAEKRFSSSQIDTALEKFIVFSPENSSLRNPHREGQIEPLGINGEGLLRLISVLNSDQKYSGVFSEIRRSLRVLGWFSDFDVVEDVGQPLSRIEIRDRYLEESRRYFDQMSTNEGFLYLLFYFSLFSCDLTPSFFAVDNIDASLNPKLCSMLMEELTRLAKGHNKQVMLTTHNPAILDGLNLDDDDQRLFVVSRNRQGHTRLKRINKPVDDGNPVRLSEAFLRGSLGGLPKGF
jgi:predicted ATPase